MDPAAHLNQIWRSRSSAMSISELGIATPSFLNGFRRALGIGDSCQGRSRGLNSTWVCRSFDARKADDQIVQSGLGIPV